MHVFTLLEIHYLKSVLICLTIICVYICSFSNDLYLTDTIKDIKKESHHYYY